MKLSVAVAAVAAMMMATPVYAQGADDIPGQRRDNPLPIERLRTRRSRRWDQTTQTKQGATSDRTPSNNQMGGSTDSMQHGGQSMQQSNQQSAGGPNTGDPPFSLRPSSEIRLRRPGSRTSRSSMRPISCTRGTATEI